MGERDCKAYHPPILKPIVILVIPVSKYHRYIAEKKLCIICLKTGKNRKPFSSKKDENPAVLCRENNQKRIRF